MVILYTMRLRIKILFYFNLKLKQKLCDHKSSFPLITSNKIEFLHRVKINSVTDRIGRFTTTRTDFGAYPNYSFAKLDSQHAPTLSLMYIAFKIIENYVYSDEAVHGQSRLECSVRIDLGVMEVRFYLDEILAGSRLPMVINPRNTISL